MEGESHEHKKKGMFKVISDYYNKNYKKLMIIPILLLVLAVIQIGFQTASTGSFVNKGIGLKGGISVSVPMEEYIDTDILQESLSQSFPENDINVRTLSSAGVLKGIIIEADIDVADSEKTERMISELASNLEHDDISSYSVEGIGSSLGESFFNEIIKAFIMAFLFMGLVIFLYFGEGWKEKTVVFTLTIIAESAIFFGNSIFAYSLAAIIIVSLLYLYFRYSIPSIAVIVAAFSDILITLAVVNLLGIRVSTAGIAAFLMIIGYSVDTDVLLTTRVIRDKVGSVVERVHNALKTGLTMNMTTLAAILIALIVTDSEVIKQIMTILLIGLFVDMINTWIQNVGILRYYLERKEAKRHSS